MPAKKTLAIVGSHPVTRNLVPWHKSYMDFWVFNESAGNPNGWVKKCDGVLQLHHPAIWKNPRNHNDPKHFEWLQKDHPFPIYMQEKYPEVPSSVRYPLDEIIHELLPNFRRKPRKKKGNKEEVIQYFTSSVAYAIALAIYQGYERIEVYGIEMMTDTEYVMQRDGVALWAGVALGRGIEFIVPDISTMFNSLLYGYGGDIVINRQEFESSTQKLSDIIEERKNKMNQATGKTHAALEALQKADNQDDANKRAELFLKAVQDQMNAVLEFGVISGALQENQRYLEKCDEMYRAVGGEKAIEAMQEHLNQKIEDRQMAVAA